MSAVVTYSLSPGADGIQEPYICSCLCFANDDCNANPQQLSAKLTATVKRTATHLPILAGYVQHVLAANVFPFLPTAHRRSSASSVFTGEQRAQVEARVSLHAVSALQPTVKVLKHDEFPHTYKSLVQSRMPAHAFAGNEGSALLPPMVLYGSANTGQPAFAVQANLIDGGVIVVLCLHQGARSIVPMATIIRYMSISDDILPARRLTLQMLQADAAKHSRARDGSADSFGNRVQGLRQISNTITGMRSLTIGGLDKSTIMFFSLRKLEETKAMINERFEWGENKPETSISTTHCLMAILWKALVRARWPQHQDSQEFDGQSSTLTVCAEVSNGIDSALSHQYSDSVRTASSTALPIVRLALPFDVYTLAETSKVVLTYTESTIEENVHSDAMLAAAHRDTYSAACPQLGIVRNVRIHDWSDLPIGDEAGLSIGLGAPQYARKLSNEATEVDCVVLPFKKDQGIWEVLVKLPVDAMERLLEDPGLSTFLIGAA